MSVIASAAQGASHSASLSPTALDFGSVTNALSSTAQIVTLSNTGSAPLSITSITTSGDFTQTNTCGSSIAKKAKCTISVTFRPSASGSRTGTLTVTDDATGSPHRVSLSGSGAGFPQALVSPSTLAFGNQNVQTESTSQSVTLSNTGSASLSISNIAVTGDFAQTNTCGASLSVGANCTISVTTKPTASGPRTGTVTVMDNAAGAPHTVALTSTGVAVGNGNLTAIWANEGGDKVTQDELRASLQTVNLTGSVLNRVWEGTTIHLSGAHNEVVSFNLVLEAARANASNVAVHFNKLTGPGGVTIASTATGDPYNWVNRPIETFFVRYLQIKGLSFFGYMKGDERQIPKRFQTPWSGEGWGTYNWFDRPDHDKFYPDIMVPSELVPTFTIAQGNNQSIWSDIYIPKEIPSGTYTGTVTVTEDGVTTHEIPVALTVQGFTLPDAPAAKTMIALDTTDIMWRYVTGHGGYVNWASSDGQRIANITDKYFELFHRHKLTLIGENECPSNDRPCDSGLGRLNGSLYTPAHGYDGPGVNTPAGVYSIGTYGTWGGATYGIPGWKDDENLFRSHIDNWASWFQNNLPGTDYFLYLQDEPSRADFGKVETWAQWIGNDPGPGHNMLSMATVDAVAARAYMPTLDIPVTQAGIGACPDTPPCDPTAEMNTAADFYRSTPGRKLWNYNDGRPGVGTSMTEDDGIAMRTLPWAQFKMGIDRWYYWYANVNSPIDWFQSAVTWGSISYFDNSIGQTGWDATSNGNGLLVYPGTDVQHTADSYGVDGPIASLRMKEWRRGIQDADYLALAKQIDPVATKAIVSRVMPLALWENTAPDGDPSWFKGTISWSSDPDDWETARAQLAQMINTYCMTNPSTSACAAQ